MFAHFLPRLSARRTLKVARCAAISNLLIFLPAFSPADSGDLDPTFGTGGLVTTDFASGNDNAFAAAIDCAGRIVLAGRAFNGSGYDLALARYDTSGNLDLSFSDDGLVTTDFDSDDDYVYAVVIQADNKIVVAGPAFVGGANDLDFALTRPRKWNPGPELLRRWTGHHRLLRR